MKISVLAHADLDGIVSAINIYNAVSNKETFRYQLTGYGNLIKNFFELANEQPDVMFITDINFSLYHFEELKKYPNIKYIYIDHHNYEYNLKEETDKLGLDITIQYNQDFCGAVNTFLYLSSNKNFNFISWRKNKEKLRELNRITNIYDLFKMEESEFPLANAFNDLFWEYKQEEFFRKFKDGYSITDADKEIQSRIQKEREEYLKESFEKYSVVNPYANTIFILNQICRFPNDFVLYYPTYDFYLILTKRTEDSFIYSFRINRKNSITLSDVIQLLKEKSAPIVSIGGHEKSGGITIAEESNTEFLNIFNEVLEGFNF